jgi:ketosteroid isomerase-like protein
MSLKTVFYRAATVCATLTLLSLPASAQVERRMRVPADETTVSFPAGKDSVEVPFETERNWIIIPVSVNGSRPLRFVLDTGAGGTGASLINSAVADSLKLTIVGRIQAQGAGSGPAMEIPIAGGVNFDIGGLQLTGGRMSVRPAIPGMEGMSATRDGVLGRPVFANLVVEIDWERKIVSLHDPAKFSYTGKGAVVPLTFDEMGRPYTAASVTNEDGKSVPVNLIVDTGGGHNLSLEIGSGTKLKAPAGATKIVLGRGASGEFTGYSAQVRGFQLAEYTLKDVPTIYPDESYGSALREGRDGNLGGGILRRFKVIYDYARKRMIIQPNKFFDEPFPAIRGQVTSQSQSVGPALPASQAPTATVSPDEQEVKRREREWLDAYERQDAQAMDNILTADFKITHPDGGLQTKADVIAQLKHGKESGQASAKFSTEEVQSRIEGNAVILTGRLVMRSDREGRARLMQARYTDRYEKRQGRWQVVSSVMTSLPQ